MVKNFEFQHICKTLHLQGVLILKSICMEKHTT